MQSEVRFARAQVQKAVRPAANNNKKIIYFRAYRILGAIVIRHVRCVGSTKCYD